MCIELHLCRFRGLLRPLQLGVKRATCVPFLPCLWFLGAELALQVLNAYLYLLQL